MNKNKDMMDTIKLYKEYDVYKNLSKNILNNQNKFILKECSTIKKDLLSYIKEFNMFIKDFGYQLFDKTAEFLKSKKPKWVTSDTLALSALELMEKHSITSLFVYSDDNLKKPDGIVHIHDILKSGIQ